METDYTRYRGKCKELSEALIKSDPDLELVRGYYFCPVWNREEQHWWCKSKTSGEIIDPTRKQFGSKGHGIYTEFDGTVECSQCGVQVPEEAARFESRYAFCSFECHGKFVGVF